MYFYSAETSDATNKITATALSDLSQIKITVNGVEKANATAPTWTTGENIVIIKVTNVTEVKTYTVTVTKGI